MTSWASSRNREEGVAMLRRLSGVTHHVYTGVALVGGDGEGTRLSVSAVSFRRLSPQECEDYWRSGEPADKAGGYAIQGRGAMFISRLEGSYSGSDGPALVRNGGIDAGVWFERFAGHTGLRARSLAGAASAMNPKPVNPFILKPANLKIYHSKIY